MRHLPAAGVALRQQDALEVLVEQRLVLEPHADIADLREIEGLVRQELDDPGAVQADILEEIPLAVWICRIRSSWSDDLKSGKAIVSVWRRRCRRL